MTWLKEQVYLVITDCVACDAISYVTIPVNQEKTGEFGIRLMILVQVYQVSDYWLLGVDCGLDLYSVIRIKARIAAFRYVEYYNNQSNLYVQETR